MTWRYSLINECWSINGILYCEHDDGIFTWDFDTKTQTKVTDLYTDDAIDYFIPGPDATLYSFSIDKQSPEQKLYRLDLSEANPSWKLVNYTFKLKTDYIKNILIGANGAYVKTLYDNDWVFINLSPQGDQKRTVHRYTYNADKQLIKTVTTAYGIVNGAPEIREYTETASYVKKHNAVTETVDKLGNRTTYTYNDSPYYIPTTVTQKYKNGPTITTTNTLLNSSDVKLNKGRIESSSTQYRDRIMTTNYTYSPSSPGNIATETLAENKGGIRTELGTTEYQYHTLGEAYVSQTKTSGLTNNENFENTKNVDLITQYAYYTNGLKKSETDAENQIITYEYNNNGWPTKTTNPDGTYTEVIYDLNGNDNTITTSYNGEYTTVEHYDELGVITVQAELTEDGTENPLKTYTFENGQVKSVKDAVGNEICYEYDVFDRITFAGVRRDEGDFEQYTRTSYNDFNMSKTVIIGDYDSATQTIYDIAGRETLSATITDAGLSKTNTYYDAMGNVKEVVDPNRNSTVNTYNDQGQLLSVKNAVGEVQKYTYDIYGNIASDITAGGSKRTNEYDCFGRLLKTTDAEGQSSYYAYDNVGRMIKSKDRNGQVVDLQYDAMGRVISQSKGGTFVTYTYDSLGNMKTMTDSTGTTNYSYTNNQLSSIKVPDGEQINYLYDAAHNVTEVEDYSGQVFNYTYTAGNLLQSIVKDNETIASYSYNKSGALMGIVTPEGNTEYEYSQGLRLSAMTNRTTDGSIINTYSYEYDVLGNQIEKTDNNGSTSYTYDKLSRLSGVQEPDGTVTEYTFDKNSNISVKSITRPENYEYAFKQEGTEYVLGRISVDETNYAYDKNNRLKEETRYIGGTSEAYSGLVEEVNQNTYDANGNLLKAEKSGQVDNEVVEYEYDEINRLTGVTAADGTFTEYSYNGLNQRVEKIQDGKGATKYYWDRNYISNEKSGTQRTTNYIGQGGVFARESGNSQAVYMMKDGHGNVTNLLSDGAVQRAYDYDAYGVEKNSDETDDNPFRYCGEYFDQETENYYLRSRYYNPGTGRFITEDPYWSVDNVFIRDIKPTKKNNTQINLLEPSSPMSNEVLNYLELLLISNNILIADDHVDDNVKHLISLVDVRQKDNLYNFCLNNPLYYVDPSGEVVIADDLMILVAAGIMALSTAIALMAEHTKNSRKSTHDKHTKKRPGAPGKAQQKPGWQNRSNKRNP